MAQAKVQRIENSTFSRVRRNIIIIQEFTNPEVMRQKHERNHRITDRIKKKKLTIKLRIKLTANDNPVCFSSARRNLPMFVDSGSGCSQSLRGMGCVDGVAILLSFNSC